MGVKGWCAGAANCSYATECNSPQGVALDPSSGVLYVFNSNSVCRVPTGGGACVCVRVAWRSCLHSVDSVSTMRAEYSGGLVTVRVINLISMRTRAARFDVFREFYV